MYEYKKGDIVKGRVTGIERYGIFVSIDDKVVGLVHISEIADTFVKSIYDYVDFDEIITCKVIDCDNENGKLNLSIKSIEYKDKSNKVKGIIETRSGFKNLGDNLEKWIDFKIKKVKKS